MSVSCGLIFGGLKAHRKIKVIRDRKTQTFPTQKCLVITLTDVNTTNSQFCHTARISIARPVMTEQITTNWRHWNTVI